MISAVGERNLPEVKTFLEQYRETSMFLLSNIENYGLRLTEELHSGNFKCLGSQGRVRAVFCLSRGGILIAQTDGSEDFSKEILKACEEEEFLVDGIVGEWNITESLWRTVLSQDRFLQTSYQSKEFLYRLSLRQKRNVEDIPEGVRNLKPGDFEVWEKLYNAYFTEEGLPMQGTRERRRKNFERQTANGYWWGLWSEGVLVSIAAYNARYGPIGQVGGVFTEPAYRRKGFSRAVMKRLIADSVERHGVDLLILFTGETNEAARKMYESLGFEQIGFYGLFFGKRTG